MRSDDSANSAQVRAMALWVIVSAGLLYGVVNTFAKVADLFGGEPGSTAASRRGDRGSEPRTHAAGRRAPGADARRRITSDAARNHYRPVCATTPARPRRPAAAARRRPRRCSRAPRARRRRSRPPRGARPGP